ncbi:MAG: DUF3750 domain-containing protein [Bdellovibrionota bacterium]
MKITFLRLVLLTFLAASLLSPFSAQAQDWRTADIGSAGLAPLPETEKRAVVQIYSARTVRWRKYFAVHTWIVTKEKDASSYQTYHVIGWRLRQGLSVVRVEEGIPDAKWFGHVPELLRDLRGRAAESAIPKIIKAAAEYPYQNEYRAWPGPNSNTFVSFILRRTPELGIELPPHAIGKDWIETGHIAGISESRTGVQLSLLGVLGLTLGLNEGIEINLLGLSFGIDFLRPALKLPMAGRIGFTDQPAFDDEVEPTGIAEEPLPVESATPAPVTYNDHSHQGFGTTTRVMSPARMYKN